MDILYETIHHGYEMHLGDTIVFFNKFQTILRMLLNVSSDCTVRLCVNVFIDLSYM